MEANNMKAMREALLSIRKALLVDSGMGPHTAFHNEVERLTAEALFAPARNCDLFATVSDARKAFNEWLKHNTPISFGGWLLRLADEREGGRDE